MGIFGSGDKTSSSADNRVGASEGSSVAQSGGGVFFGGGRTSPVTSNNTLWILAGVIGAAWLVWKYVFKK